MIYVLCILQYLVWKRGESVDIASPRFLHSMAISRQMETWSPTFIEWLQWLFTVYITVTIDSTYSWSLNNLEHCMHNLQAEYPGNHCMLTQYWVNVGPPSTTLDQHWPTLTQYWVNMSWLIIYVGLCVQYYIHYCVWDISISISWMSVIGLHASWGQISRSGK